MSWFHWQNTDLLLSIKVQPGASSNNIAGLHGAQLKLRLHAPPIDGRANDALVDYLSECFHLSKSAVQIEHGQNSRNKQIRIRAPKYLPETLRALGLTSLT